jgi:hypothetical protein
MREIMGGGKVFFGGNPRAGGTGFNPAKPNSGGGADAGAGSGSIANRTANSINSIFGALGVAPGMFGEFLGDLKNLSSGNWIQNAVKPLQDLADRQPDPRWPDPITPRDRDIPIPPFAENRPPAWMGQQTGGGTPGQTGSSQGRFGMMSAAPTGPTRFSQYDPYNAGRNPGGAGRLGSGYGMTF